MTQAGLDAADPVRWPIAPRIVRSRAKGVVNPDGIDVARPGRFGNPFKVDGAAAKALAGQNGPVSWLACQWAAARLYAVAVALRDILGEGGEAETAALQRLQNDLLPGAVLTKFWAECPVPLRDCIPTRAEIMQALGGQPVRCWCKLQVDCHGDVLRGVAAGWAPLDTIPARPFTRGGIRHAKSPPARFAYRSGGGGHATNW